MTVSRTPSSRSAEAERFESFVDKNFPPAYRFAFCMSLAHESATALTQAAFAEARRARREDENPTLDKRWLLATLHREWVDRRTQPEGGGSGHAPSRAEPLLKAQDVAGFDQQGVLETLHEMEEKLRLALSLFYFEQLSYTEIAEILKIAPELVLAHLGEAKGVLRRQLEKNRTDSAAVARRPVAQTAGSPDGKDHH